MVLLYWIATGKRCYGGSDVENSLVLFVVTLTAPADRSQAMTHVERAESRAAVPGRWSVTAVFFLNGMLLCSYLVRIPSLKAGQHLDDGQLGLVGMLFGASALVTMQFVGAMVAKIGTSRVIRLGLFLMPLLLVATGLREGVWVFLLAIVGFAAVHGTLDVAMNSQAVTLERRAGRPILSGCHAAWSVSAVIASLIGVCMVALGVNPAPDFGYIGSAVIVGGVLVGRRLLDTEAGTSSSKETRVRWRSGWNRTVIRLGLTGFALMLGEGAALGWGAIFLHENRGASLALASTALTAYTGFQTIGRLRGDRLKMQHGARTMFRVGALVAASGFAIALLSPWPVVCVMGFAIFGLGASSLIPMTYSAAGNAGGDGPEAAVFVSRFTTFTYSGVLLGPALIGAAAQLIGLSWTLAVLLPVLLWLAAVSLPGNRVGAGSSEPTPTSFKQLQECVLVDR
jgi:predicted MFS family arabinose efflux permease